MSDETYGLVVSFADQSASYVHGFEAGMIWRDLETNYHGGAFSYTVHAENMETIRRMCTAMGFRIYHEVELMHGWVEIQIAKDDRPRLVVIDGGLAPKHQRPEK
jgi:hypothetical protein